MTKIEQTVNLMKEENTFKRYQEGDHTYKVKTDAISIDPENLSTTFDIGVDSSISIDSAVQPFIVMEYLIKI